MMPAMAAPNRNRSKPTDAAFEKTRGKIQSTQLINALMDHILERNNRGDMKPSQVTAALGLLKKTTPDLASVKLIGDVDQPVETRNTIEVTFVDQKGGKK